MAVTRFQTCLDEILRQEGGYVDHKADPGGATNLGVTRKTLARWRGVSPWWNLAKAEVKALGKPEASAIYRAGFWTPIAGNAQPVGLDMALFDFAVNSGPGRAVRILQALLKVRQDGIVGPVTLGAITAEVERGGVAELIARLCDQRMGFLARLKTFATFGRGWSRRVREIKRLALTAAGADINFQPEKRTQEMDILSGYRTYIIGVFMLLAGVAQALGIDIPGFDGQSTGHLIMEGIAIVFLRRGIKGDVGNA